ncbi:MULTISPECIES: response regulator [unclassified Marinobacterium]|uniref:hybrid sensor histidine kinase/response regulator n=1 Tax=unclassified Marinobacterium TaxID=2644139 RepID=UPI00156A3370|nr:MULTISPECIES: response regulator [unclassified Marinobacterium]NRP51844.1 Aerobic respiration control sensor protein ArcB [Marinobacterium sp. xm-v-242]NRP76425.1 Aerobic respiration control sensor protein ArcB [Marinobacterium sp. xm-m-383]
MRNRHLINRLIELSKTADHHDILSKITQAFSEAYSPSLVFVGVLVDSHAELIEGHAAFRGEEPSEPWVYCMTDQPCALVYKGKKVSIPCDVQKDFIKKEGSGLESFLGLPINHPTAGTLAHFAVYDSQPNHFDDIKEETLCLLQTLIEREYWRIHALRAERVVDLFSDLEIGIHRTETATGKIVEINPYLSEKTGIKINAQQAVPIWEMDLLSSENQIKNRVFDQNLSHESLYKLDDDREFPVEVRTICNPADSLMNEHWVSVVLDQTERLAREKELRLALEQLKAKQEQQKQFFAVVGHELRTPIASINMLLKDESIPREEIDTYLKSTASNLLDVLEDLRFIGEPEKRVVQFKTATPESIIQGVCGSLHGLLLQRQQQLTLSLQESGQFVLPVQAIRQICTNLIKNASIHSGGHQIAVSLTHASDQNLLQIVVEDDGVGIPKEALEDLLKPFNRGKTDADGTGLGLYIVKEIANAIEAKLDYSTSELGGAKFILEFAVNEPEIKNSSQIRDSINFSDMRILIAEDNKTLQLLTQKMLSKVGAHVEVADNGRDALQLVKRDSFDLVITDLNMPEMNGLELIEQLTKQDFKGTILGCTAAITGNETEQTIIKGAKEVIPKPISLDQIEQALK